ncbi:hypothetical protein GUJ93_ZPchr0006g44744 [Zizania palustris]|uniref:Uncharacterized protein n=1 Tax=Zizania palustris TaxID=103762 RepID=A0A8J5S990_ZIZPA|nr:hypothetical protein GUJ93_ZPchr0006g44744 [Zizania palustris]
MGGGVGLELMGCLCRIKNCAAELLSSMEEDLVTDLDDDSMDLVGRDLRLKTTFLYVDLSRVISCDESNERREALTLLANKFIFFVEELTDAVTSRNVAVVKVCYIDAAQALREVVAFLAPPQSQCDDLEEQEEADALASCSSRETEVQVPLELLQKDDESIDSRVKNM